MSRPTFDVVVFEPGAMFLDLIFEGLPKFPALGEEIFARDLTIAPGGAYNTAVGLARLGLKVALVTQIGTDLFSQYLEERLAREHVDTTHLIRVNGNARAVTVSLSYPKDRAFVSYVDREDCFDFPTNLLTTAETRAFLQVRMPHRPQMVALAKMARDNGVRVAMDLHLPWGAIDNPDVCHILSHADLILPNGVEAKRIANARNVRSALTRLSAFTTTVIKDGPGGALALSGGRVLRIAPIPTRVVDTTGAGDNFNAGFLSGWVRDLPLEDCMQRGNACAGLSVAHAGATTGSPNAQQLAQALKHYKKGAHPQKMKRR